MSFLKIYWILLIFLRVDRAVISGDISVLLLEMCLQVIRILMLLGARVLSCIRVCMATGVLRVGVLFIFKALMRLMMILD